MGNKEKDWRNIDIRTLDYKESEEYIWRFDRKKYQNYQKYLRDVAGLDIKKYGTFRASFEKQMNFCHQTEQFKIIRRHTLFD